MSWPHYQMNREAAEGSGIPLGKECQWVRLVGVGIGTMITTTRRVPGGGLAID